jgi:hypothetical protein
MENKIDKIMSLIEKDGLITKSRYRCFLDKRSYLYAMLSKEGMSLVQIGAIFNKTHATVINGIKQYYAYQKFKDDLYEHNVQEYREIFYVPKKVNVDLIEKDGQKYNGTQLITDVLECRNTTELQDIKKKIINDNYFFKRVSYLE